MDAWKTPKNKTYAIERQFRSGQKFERLSGGLGLAEGLTRLNYCVARARGDGFNSATEQLRLVCEQVEGYERVIECVDLGAERRAKAKARFDKGGGVDGMLDREIRKNMSVGRDGVIGGRLDVVG